MGARARQIAEREFESSCRSPGPSTSTPRRWPAQRGRAAARVTATRSLRLRFQRLDWTERARPARRRPAGAHALPRARDLSRRPPHRAGPDQPRGQRRSPDDRDRRPVPRAPALAGQGGGGGVIAARGLRAARKGDPRREGRGAGPGRRAAGGRAGHHRRARPRARPRDRSRPPRHAARRVRSGAPPRGERPPDAADPARGDRPAPPPHGRSAVPRAAPARLTPRMIWNAEAETQAPAARAALQAERLRATVAWAVERVPFHRERLGGVSVRGLEDLPALPFTRKSDLREHYPFGLFAVPTAELARIHASSGTKGKPTVVGYTAGDLDVWREVDGAGDGRGRRAPRRHAPRGLRLRPLHRRPRLSRRRRADRHDGRAGVLRQHRAPPSAAAGLPAGRHLRHAILRAAHRREPGRAGGRPARARPALRHVRRRAVDGRSADRDRARLRPARVRHLRAVRDHRPRRGRRVRAARRPARLRRSFPAGDRRSRHRRGAAARAGRGARADHADQARHSDGALPHRRHHERSPPSRAPAAGPRRASRASRAAPTTC